MPRYICLLSIAAAVLCAETTPTTPSPRPPLKNSAIQTLQGEYQSPRSYPNLAGYNPKESCRFKVMLSPSQKALEWRRKSEVRYTAGQNVCEAEFEVGEPSTEVLQNDLMKLNKELNAKTSSRPAFKQITRSLAAKSPGRSTLGFTESMGYQIAEVVDLLMLSLTACKSVLIGNGTTGQLVSSLILVPIVNTI